jgi:hypothetical protein
MLVGIPQRKIALARTRHALKTNIKINLTRVLRNVDLDLFQGTQDWAQWRYFIKACNSVAC